MCSIINLTDLEACPTVQACLRRVPGPLRPGAQSDHHERQPPRARAGDAQGRRLHRRRPPQAARRRRQHLDRNRALQPAPAPPRRAVKDGVRAAGGDADGVQHRLGVRRHHHGHRGHADVARQPRGDRRLDRARRARQPVRRARHPGRLRQDDSRRGDGARAARRSRPRALRRVDRARAVAGQGRHHPGRVRGGRRVRLRPLERTRSSPRSRTAPVPGAGACGGQFTANTMATACEFLGLSPFGSATVPAMDPDKDDVARQAGALAVDLLVARPAAAADPHAATRSRTRSRRSPPPADRPMPCCT